MLANTRRFARHLALMRMKYLSIILIALIPFYGDAAQYSYECTIAVDLRFDKDGKLIPTQNIYLNKIFGVDRKTGVVLGGGLGNSSYETKTIIDPGGKWNSFKLLWQSYPIEFPSGTGRNAVYLAVEEYNENHLKPFVLVDGSTVLSGTCK